MARLEKNAVTVEGVGKPVAGLKKNAITLVGAVAATCAFIGPGASVYFNSGIGIQNAGNAFGFAFVIAMIATMFVAYTISQFARKLPTAGFAYTFAVHGFGKRAGFLTGWLLIGGYAMVGPMVLAAIGYFMSQFCSQYLGIHITWGIFTAIIAVIILALANWGISHSVKVALIMFVIEISVLVWLFLTILGKGGAQGVTFAAFNPHNSLGRPYNWNGIGTAVLWSMLMFTGFESAATLGEETTQPKRNIPRALYISVVGCGIFFLIAAFSAVVGYGPANVVHIVDSINRGNNPWDSIASTFWGSKASIIVMLVILNSVFANMLSGFNAVVRVFYSMGAEGVFPRFMGEVSSRQVPVKAATFYMAASLVVALILGYIWGPMTVYGWTGDILGLALLITYVIINIALIVFYLKHHRSEFNIAKHCIIPIIATILLFLPLKGVVMSTLPGGGGTAPMTSVPYVLGAWIVIGVLYTLYLGNYRQDVLEGAGKVFGEQQAEFDMPMS